MMTTGDPKYRIYIVMKKKPGIVVFTLFSIIYIYILIYNQSIV